MSYFEDDSTQSCSAGNNGYGLPGSTNASAEELACEMEAYRAAADAHYRSLALVAAVNEANYRPAGCPPGVLLFNDLVSAKARRIQELCTIVSALRKLSGEDHTIPMNEWPA